MAFSIDFQNSVHACILFSLLRSILVAQADTLHKIVPCLIQSLTSPTQDDNQAETSNSNSSGADNALLLTLGKSAATKIVDIFKNPQHYW